MVAAGAGEGGGGGRGTGVVAAGVREGGGERGWVGRMNGRVEVRVREGEGRAGGGGSAQIICAGWPRSRAERGQLRTSVGAIGVALLGWLGAQAPTRGPAEEEHGVARRVLVMLVAAVTGARVRPHSP